MSIAIAVKHMLAAGVDHAKIVAAIDEMERASKPKRSKHAESQARYRAKLRQQVITSDHRDHCDDGDGSTSPDKEKSPTPPKEIIPSVSSLRSETNGRVREREGWPSGYRDEFWGRYPHKVGKADALRKLEGIAKRGAVSFDDVMAGLERYIRDKPPDRAWCNPATWLHQERWTDEPQNVTSLPARRNNDRDDQQNRFRAAFGNADRAFRTVGGA